MQFKVQKLFWNFIMVLLVINLGSCLDNGGDETSTSSEEIIGLYNVNIKIGTCDTNNFNLTFGDASSMYFRSTKKWSEESSDCYLPVPGLGKGYSINADGIDFSSTVSVMHDNINTIIIDENVYHANGTEYTGHFKLTFDSDLNSFTIIGSVENNEDGACVGDVTGSGTR